MKSRMSLMFLVFLAALIGTGIGGEWVTLFNGKSLDGWSVHSGTATYRVEDGMIVGATAEGSPNTFLCTAKEYGNFILEFEVKVDDGLNSGVQFRSLIAGENTVTSRVRDGKEQQVKLPKDRVYGYQVEIANGTANNGNVYDEARRAVFLQDFAGKADAQKAYKNGDWNKYRIECRGDRIQTWINGVPCADFRDSVTAKGIIGLQVHGVGKNYKLMHVRWRNIRLQEL